MYFTFRLNSVSMSISKRRLRNIQTVYAGKYLEEVMKCITAFIHNFYTLCKNSINYERQRGYKIMLSKEESNNCQIHSLGREVAIFRALLDMTQQELAEVMSTSRVTINKIENAKDSAMISLDVGFRLYYITQKVINNQSFSEFTRFKAKELQCRIEQEVLSR